jgi:hypothetical protein
MTEQLAHTIAFIPLLSAIAVMRISRNPRYLVLSAALTGLSSILILILSPNHKYVCLVPIALTFFILFVKWVRDKWDRKYR